MESVLNCIKEIQNRKFIILGVAFGWSDKKGLDIFKQLSNRLDNEHYQVVLVGTDDDIDRCLPQNIISVHRTQNQYELAELYTMADVFVMPTKEENFPTVNLEALACGTPVVTFNTGGSAEMLNEKVGIVVPVNDVERMEQSICNICEKKLFSEKDCRSQAKKYENSMKYREYLKLYNTIIEENCI